MAKPRSEEKRRALLDAATNVIASQGISAPVIRISQEAGVAEGTLFKYFPTKDDLLNQLYLQIKADLHRFMTETPVAADTHRDRVLHLWKRFVEWGSEFPSKRKAMMQLDLSERVLPSNKVAGWEEFNDIVDIIHRAPGWVNDEISIRFSAAVMDAIGQITIDFTHRYPEKADSISAMGFSTFWKTLLQPDV